MTRVLNMTKWAVLALSLGLMAACSDSESDSSAAKPSAANNPPAEQSTLEAAKAAGKIRIGYANEAPYAYLDTSTNQITGEAVEIARVVLKRMGINEVEGVLTEFGSLIPGLQAKRFDVIAAGMYITPERCQQAAFSNPTYGVGESFLVQKGNPKQLHSYEDIAKNDDIKFGVVVGAIQSEYARKMDIPLDRVVVFPDVVSALSGVQAGRADAYAATAMTVNDLMKKSATADLEKAEPFTDPVIDGKSVRGYGAFAFRKDDQEFVDAFNSELAKFIGTEEHAKVVQPFGFTEGELPGDVTAAKLCGAGAQAGSQ